MIGHLLWSIRMAEKQDIKGNEHTSRIELNGHLHTGLVLGSVILTYYSNSDSTAILTKVAERDGAWR